MIAARLLAGGNNIKPAALNEIGERMEGLHGSRKGRWNAVTREALESYRSMYEEIQELNDRLEHIMEDDTIIGSSTVLDYRSGFPVPQGVVGTNWERYDRLKKQYKDRICILDEKCRAIEEYIENIGDSVTRRIFRMYFLEGKKQKEIGRLTHMDRSVVSRKINDFLKVAHKTQKTHL